MALTSDDVTRLATLARLDFPPAEAATLLTQLNGFFSIVEAMRAVDTSGVEPLATPLAAWTTPALRLRADEVTEHIDEAQRERNQRSAPAVEAGVYLVPRVIE